MIVFILIAVFFFIGIFLAIYIPFVLTLRNTLLAIAPHNRRMEPNMTWLAIVPIVAIVFKFILVARMSESIELELKERNIPAESNPTWSIGMSWATCCGIYYLLYACRMINKYVIARTDYYPRGLGIADIFSFIFSLVILILFILYWINVFRYRQIFRYPSPPYQ